jgi:hypothetical protein
VRIFVLGNVEFGRVDASLIASRPRKYLRKRSFDKDGF